MTALIDQQRRQLADWLAERALDLALGEEREPNAPLCAFSRYDAAATAWRAGDVAVMCPVGSGWGPVYGLLIEQHDAGWWTVPFGRYATPAVPGEWTTGLAAPPLRVACGWNLRFVPPERFLPGAAKRLTEKQMIEVRRCMDHIKRGVALGSALAKRLGPPLFHPADPRYAYLEEERERLDAHLPAVHEIVAEDDRAPSSWLLAAEGRPVYGDADPIK